MPPRNIHTQGPCSPVRNAPMGHCGPSPGHGSPFLLVCAPVWGGEACNYTPGQENSGAKCKQVSEAPSPSSSVILSVTQQTCLSSCSVPGPVQGEPFLSTSKSSLTGSHTRGPWPKLVCRCACSGRHRPELSGPPNGHHCAGTRGHVPQGGQTPPFLHKPHCSLTPHTGRLTCSCPASLCGLWHLQRLLQGPAQGLGCGGGQGDLV